MRRFFQIPNFKRDEYNRPEQKWVCGRVCDGKGCPFGPDAAGQCRTTGECRPVRNADRWVCTRADTHGGPCPDGPLPSGECCRQIGPCQPVLSLRAMRGRFVWGALGCTLGLLLLLFAGPGRDRWVNPGPLSSAHALSNARCSDCHAPARAKAKVVKVDGLDAFLPGYHNPTSPQCLECHNLGPNPLSAHGFDPARLAAAHQIKAPAAATLTLALAKKTLTAGTDKLECALCHQEHHGRDHALTGFSNQQCQVCHQKTFDSFSKGHPEFASYPYQRRTRIVFDHASHLLVHFQDKKTTPAPISCSACHEPSPTGTVMLVKSFEQTCIVCHGAQIEGQGRAGDKGIAFFRVPALDAATLAAKGHVVGEWPRDAEGGITPFMRLLLARDPAATAALAELDGVDLGDLRHLPEAKLAAAETLAWCVKSLFADLVTDGQQAIVSRLTQIAPAAPHEELRAMTAQLPRDGLMAAQTAWFPALFTEMANYRAGKKPELAPAADTPAAVAAAQPASAPSSGDDLLADSPPPKSTALAAPAAANDLLTDAPAPVAMPAAGKPAAPAIAPLEMKDAEAWAAAGGWYRPTDGFTLYYRPTGHADAFMTIWLTTAGQLAGDTRTPVAKALFASLSETKAPGLCIKCHSIDSIPQSTALLVNWHASRPVPDAHPSTKFSHTAHFSLLTEEGCQTCHKLNPKRNYIGAFSGNLDPTLFKSSFDGVAKATCAACHNDQVAGEDCRLCHNYHTGEFAASVAGVSRIRPISKDALPDKAK